MHFLLLFHFPFRSVPLSCSLALSRTLKKIHRIKWKERHFKTGFNHKFWAAWQFAAVCIFRYIRATAIDWQRKRDKIPNFFPAKSCWCCCCYYFHWQAFSAYLRTAVRAITIDIKRICKWRILRWIFNLFSFRPSRRVRSIGIIAVAERFSGRRSTFTRSAYSPPDVKSHRSTTTCLRLFISFKPDTHSASFSIYRE